MNQWLLGFSSSLDYDLYNIERELACFVYLCHHTFTNEGCELRLFLLGLVTIHIYRSMSGLSRSCCRWPESKTTVHSKCSLDFVLLCLRANGYLDEPEWRVWPGVTSKLNVYRILFLCLWTTCHVTSVNLILCGKDVNSVHSKTV